MRWWVIALVLGAGMTGGGCVVDLDHVLACGDGHVDELAGEECDPNVPESFEDGCVGTTRPFGNARCDPDTCELIATELQCARCGDGIVDIAAGEQCDGSNIGAVCPDGTRPACSLECTIAWESCGACGNGAPDVGEECDPEGGALAVPISCAGDDPLRSPNAAKPYASGTAVSCTPSCEYDRRDCGYCGDGVQDGALQLSRDGTAVSWPEMCDGDDFDEGAVEEEYSVCASLGLRANVACDDDCFGFALRDEDVPCCVPSGAACPEDGGGLECCYALAHPDGGDACLPVLTEPEEGGGSGEGGGAMLCR